jgi:hypothetical protein
MAKSKKLSSSVILKQNAKEFVQKKATIDIDGEDYEFLVDQNFRISKIQEMIFEGLSNHKNYKNVNETVRILYFSYLIIKHFTNIDFSQVKTFEDEIRMINSLLDLNIIEGVFKHVPEGEILKVKDFMSKVNEKIIELEKKGEKIPGLKEIIEKEVIVK